MNVCRPNSIFHSVARRRRGYPIPHVYVCPSFSLLEPSLVIGNASAHPACAPRTRHAMGARLAF